MLGISLRGFNSKELMCTDMESIHIRVGGRTKSLSESLCNVSCRFENNK